MNKPAFCAHCVCERDDLLPVDFDGRTLWLCWSCREGPTSAYSFVESEASMEQTVAAQMDRYGVEGGKRKSLGHGNYRITAGGLSLGARGK